jgi:hypothetical protein
VVTEEGEKLGNRWYLWGGEECGHPQAAESKHVKMHVFNKVWFFVLKKFQIIMPSQVRNFSWGQPLTLLTPGATVPSYITGSLSEFWVRDCLNTKRALHWTTSEQAHKIHRLSKSTATTGFSLDLRLQDCNAHEQTHCTQITVLPSPTFPSSMCGTGILQGVTFSPHKGLWSDQGHSSVGASGVGAPGSSPGGSKINMENIWFFALNKCKLLRQIKGHSMNNCDYFKIHNLCQSRPLWLLAPSKKPN